MDFLIEIGTEKNRLAELEKLMADSEVISNKKRYQEVLREHKHTLRILEQFEEKLTVEHELQETKALLQKEEDEELLAMCRQEISTLEARLVKLIESLQLLLLPADPLDARDTIMEIRAGTGGDEAALFAGDLYRMYLRYTESRGWKSELISANEQEQGGYKEVIFSISGEAVYSFLRYESGTHRVQRVPVTESSGRIHTSAATVAVLPEAEEIDVDIQEKDLRIDTYRAQGAGGQHVNTTDSAVRITHLPSNIVVQCQDERSQIKNRSKAMKVLRARLLEHQIEQEQQQRAASRKKQVGSGDRSQRIRTYNFPQNRLTDHRIGLTLYRLDSILLGELELVIQPLVEKNRQQRLLEYNNSKKESD